MRDRENLESAGVEPGRETTPARKPTGRELGPDEKRAVSGGADPRSYTAGRFALVVDD